MKLMVNGFEAHVATGGKKFDKNLPTMLFLHGRWVEKGRILELIPDS